jgi:hypothetical protein
VALVPGGGLTWLQYELALPLAMLVVMLVFVPVLRGLQLVSVYEYLERRFDRATRLLLSAVFLLSRGLAAGVALYAAALVVQVCTGLPLVWCIVGMGVLTLVYDTLGGMRAVVWTDVVQMIVLLLGIGVCAVYAWQAVGGGAAILDQLAPERWPRWSWRTAWAMARAPGCGASWWADWCCTWPTTAWTKARCSARWRRTACAAAQRCCCSTGWRAFRSRCCTAAWGWPSAAVYGAAKPCGPAVPAGRLDYLVPRFIEPTCPSACAGCWWPPSWRPR